MDKHLDHASAKSGPSIDDRPLVNLPPLRSRPIELCDVSSSKNERNEGGVD